MKLLEICVRWLAVTMTLSIVLFIVGYTSNKAGMALVADNIFQNYGLGTDVLLCVLSMVTLWALDSFTFWAVLRWENVLTTASFVLTLPYFLLRISTCSEASMKGDSGILIAAYAAEWIVVCNVASLKVAASTFSILFVFEVFCWIDCAINLLEVINTEGYSWPLNLMLATSFGFLTAFKGKNAEIWWENSSVRGRLKSFWDGLHFSHRHPKPAATSGQDSNSVHTTLLDQSGANAQTGSDVV